ncbi:MAG: glycosyltransferase [Bacteroidia bacterium]
MIWIFAISIFFTGLIYSGLLVFCILGWKNLPEFEASENTADANKFSVIIPARNEQNNIANCLQDIVNQDYNINNFEIIVVDDFSEDETVNEVEKFKIQHTNHQIHICQLSKMLRPGNYNSYKKLAIEQGILQSSFHWIITTDADCFRGKNWLRTIAAFIFQNQNIKLISAPVKLVFSDSFFEKAQALEFSGLIGIGAACISRKMPTMCNGANLIYQKSAFYEVDGFRGNNNLASGDDEFLMHKIAAKHPEDVMFLKSKSAIVSTPALTSISTFLQQRKRWASKSRNYSSLRLTLLLAAIYMFYLLTLICFISGFYDYKYFVILLVGLCLKCIPEWIFLRNVSGFFNQSKLMKYYLPTLFFQTLYVVIIGIYANFGKYNWKGRQVK